MIFIKKTWHSFVKCLLDFGSSQTASEKQSVGGYEHLQHRRPLDLLLSNEEIKDKHLRFEKGLLFSAVILLASVYSQGAIAELGEQKLPISQIETPPPPYSLSPDRSTTVLLQKISNPLLAGLDNHLFNIKTITEEFIAKLIPTSKKNAAYLYTQSELPTCSFRNRSNCLQPELKNEIEKNPLNSIYVAYLFDPLVLATDIEQTHAKNAINALLRSISPLQPIDFPKLFSPNELPLKIQDQPIKEYIASFRAYSTSLSFALSNIFALYEERMPIGNLDKVQQEALLQLQKEDWVKGYKIDARNISRAKLSKISATYRLLDKKWNEEQAQNPPVALQRETNQLLAEIRASLEEMKTLQEKTVMALSLLLLENSNVQRSKMTHEAQQITSPNH